MKDIEKRVEEFERKAEKFKNELDDFDYVKKTLVHDEKKCLMKALETGDQFWYRMFVRSFFAHIEGQLYKLQIQALKWDKTNNLNKITNAEEAIIKQENYGLNKKGEVDKYPSYDSIEKKLRFSIHIQTKVHELDYSLDLGSDNRWNDFKKSIDIRNELTHPKKKENLILSDDNIQTLLNATNWFLETFNGLSKAVSEKYPRDRDEIGDIEEAL